ncbi:MAG TPA: hypothetical protein VJ161_04295 [Geobacteraceae bacterium]|nr:hypothetical protein [Geobacteraceae bacterium]
MNRQKLLLSVLLAVLVLSVAYSIWKMPRQKTVATLPHPPGSAAQVKKTPDKAVSDENRVRMDLLDRKSEKFSGFKRNIFGPIIQEQRKPTAKRAAPAVRPVPPIQMPQPSPVQRDMAQFTFLGFLKKDNRKTIFLTSNNEIFLVKKGDIIAGKYNVADVTDEMMTIRSSTNGGEIIIPLVENMPLNVTGQ